MRRYISYFTTCPVDRLVAKHKHLEVSGNTEEKVERPAAEDTFGRSWWRQGRYVIHHLDRNTITNEWLRINEVYCKKGTELIA